MFKVNNKDTGATYKFVQVKIKTAEQPFGNNNQH